MYPCTPFVLPLIYSQFGFSIFPPTLPCSSPRQQSSVIVHHCGAGATPGRGEHRGVRNRHMQRERTCVPSGIQQNFFIFFHYLSPFSFYSEQQKFGRIFFYAFGSLIIPDTPSHFIMVQPTSAIFTLRSFAVSSVLFVAYYSLGITSPLFSGFSPCPQYYSRPTVISGVTSPYFLGFSPCPQYHSRPTVVSGVTAPLFSGFLAESPVPFAAYCYSRALHRLYFWAPRLLSQISAIILRFRYPTIIVLIISLAIPSYYAVLDYN